ncbi:hypothetical protein D029_4738A, partial [Vibrio parahaemolyticus 970107]
MIPNKKPTLSAS